MFITELLFGSRTTQVTVELNNEANTIVDLACVVSWALDNREFAVTNNEHGGVEITIEIYESSLGNFISQMSRNNIRIL